MTLTASFASPKTNAEMVLLLISHHICPFRLFIYTLMAWSFYEVEIISSICAMLRLRLREVERHFQSCQPVISCQSLHPNSFIIWKHQWVTTLDINSLCMKVWGYGFFWIIRSPWYCMDLQQPINQRALAKTRTGSSRLGRISKWQNSFPWTAWDLI